MQILLFFTLLFVVVYSETVITPFGIRPEECVIEVPHGSTVTPSKTSNELIITVPATESKSEYITSYKVPSHCGEDMEKIRQRKRSPSLPRTEEGAPTDTNGWLDYVGWYPPSGENNLRKFTSTYVVPPGNPGDSTGQVLFYFIGMQDNDSPNAVNILQPVLTWGNGYTEWYVKSWVCCPSNITVSSPPIFGLVPGSQISGVISRESANTWLVDSVFDGKHTTLNAQVGDYIYNWADITLEVYHIKSCPDFAPGKMVFNDLVLTDAQGATITPQWQKDSGATLCGGTIAANGPNSYYIEHTNN